MTDYPLTWLADVLRAGGCRVVEESGWKTRGRPSSSGTFRPRSLLRHWDASPPGSHSTSTLLNGNSSAPGPLCSIWTCAGNSSHEPSVHVIAAGRCNHGGTGDGWGAMPQDDANTYAVGHEIRQTVDQPWPADQLEQVRMAEAAILAHLDAQASNGLCSHSEYAPGRKIDTTEGDDGQDMGDERKRVQGYIDGTPEEDDMRHVFVDLTASDVGRLKPASQFVAWNKEGSDTGGTHAPDAGAVKALWPCTMNGVLQVQVMHGPVDIEVDRYDSGEYLNRVGYLYDLEAGTHRLPFVGIWGAGQHLYVVAHASADDDGTAELGQVRIMFDQLERS